MDENKLTEIMDSIQEKVGKDVSATIADDLGRLITENDASIKDRTNLESRIKDLESKNEKLVAANGSLLQQVSMGDDDYVQKPKEKTEAEDKPISWKDCFDKRGNFLK